MQRSMELVSVLLVFMAISFSSTPVYAQTSTCVVDITGNSMGGVASAAMSCSGASVTVTGAAALAPFVGGFKGMILSPASLPFPLRDQSRPPFPHIPPDTVMYDHHLAFTKNAVV